MHEGMTLLQHAILVILINLPKIVDKKDGQNNNNKHKNNAHNNNLVLLPHQEGRQCNTNIE